MDVLDRTLCLFIKLILSIFDIIIHDPSLSFHPIPFMIQIIVLSPVIISGRVQKH